MGVDGQLPKGWQERRLDEVADIRFSNVDKHLDAAQQRVRLCNYMDVWKNQYIHRGLDFMEGTATEQEIDRFGLQVGDVLLTKDSETREEIAEPSVVWDRIEGLVLGYHLALLRTDPESAYGPFLAAQLRIPEFRSQLVRAASGVTRYGLGLDAVKAATVWLPPVQKQRLIAGVIRAFDEEIEATRAVIQQIGRLRTALLDQLILRGLPQHKTRFSHCHLGEIFEERKEKGRPGLPTLSVTMNGGLVDRESLERRVVSDLAPDEHLLVCKGDIAYNMMRMWQGVFGLAWQDGIVSPAYVVLKPKSTICSHYAYYLFQHPTTIRKFERFSQGLTGDRLRLYFDQFAPIPVEIPDRDTQKKIASSLQAVDDRCQAEADKLGALLSLKTALSQSLLTGLIRVPEKPREGR